jgi:hypothetical protein
MRTEENNSFSVITVFGVTVSEITESVAQVTVWAWCLRRPKMAVTPGYAVNCEYTLLHLSRDETRGVHLDLHWVDERCSAL